MKNNKQKSQYWRNLDQKIDDHNSIVDDKTLIEQFLIECGKYGDTANIPDKVIETYIRREKIKMEDIESDAKEIVIIKQCAEESTSKASSYTEGYTEGYKRAVDYMTDTLKNTIQIKENGSNNSTTVNTTGTTFLCTEFVSDQLFYKGTLPRCMKCGKPSYQHHVIIKTTK